MIWYLLYPLRGTTEPPALAPNHPLRRSFTNYGREASRHPVITLLVSIAVAACLIYPFPYLYTNNFTNGASNLPHHVWTAAQPVEHSYNAEPDVVMRSVWVHGSYMKALEPHVLQTALEIQDELLGPTVHFDPRLSASALKEKSTNLPTELTAEFRDAIHAANGLTDRAWFFHSPLLYWNCSAEEIAADKDIISTVNTRSNKHTTVNVTLRHPIVFSGKRFEDHHLVAADALVITLIHMVDSPVGKHWEQQAQRLADLSNGKWRLYPQSGRVVDNQLYEFKFQPVSVYDDLVLAVAYGLALLYFVLTLTRLRALKSRWGLTLAVITQIAISVMASFTICAVLKIDLSKIPREAYPLVVLTVGLENMFRLVNAVIATPSSATSSARVSEALGQTGHIALAGVSQNLIILWLLHQVVSPGVAAFCIFAAIALVLDLLLLLTYFVAVLSVDVARLELSDSLGTAELRSKRGLRREEERTSWFSAIRKGEAPLSTRIAGTMVMVSFILIIQWHFFDNESPLRTFRRLRGLFKSGSVPRPSRHSSLSVDINQARSPTAWLKMQDHETAREVIQVIKPKAHSYIARVYDPLILVLEGSDRTPNASGVRQFLPAMYDFLRNQATSFVISIVFIVAAVTLFMNYLLWNEDDTDSVDETESHKEDPLLAVTTLAQGHALDVAMLTASPDGVVVSVGLDRRIKIWDLRQEKKTHFVAPCNKGISPFPVIATAVDDQAEWVAFLSISGLIMLWDISNRCWGPSETIDIKSRTPLSFFFRPTKAEAIAPLVLIRPNGLLTEIDFVLEGHSKIIDLQLCRSPLVCTKEFIDKFTGPEPALRLVTASRRGCVHLASQLPDKWQSDDVPLYAPEEDKEVQSVLPLPSLGLFLAIRQNGIDLVHVKTRGIIHTFQGMRLTPSTVQCFHSVKRKPHCGMDGLASFSLAYMDRDSGDLVLITYVPKREGDLICIGPKKCNSDPSCNAWTEAKQSIHKVTSPGTWQALPSGAIVGVRKGRRRQSSRSSFDTYVSSPAPSTTGGLRRRSAPGAARAAPVVKVQVEEDFWEAWMISANGERHSQVLHGGAEGKRMEHQLFVAQIGPITRVGRRSVAVGFGNVIKIITVGHERFETVEDGGENVVNAIAGRRRKGQVRPGTSGGIAATVPPSPVSNGCAHPAQFGGCSSPLVTRPPTRLGTPMRQPMRQPSIPVMAYGLPGS